MEKIDKLGSSKFSKRRRHEILFSDGKFFDIDDVYELWGEQ